MRLHNRQVKSGWWTDGELLRWPMAKRVLYLGLTQLAEDSGCLEHDAFAMKLLLFPSPVDADITVEQIDTWLVELIDAGKLVRYEVDGKSYLYLKNFDKHQNVRNCAKPEVPLPAWVTFNRGEEQVRGGNYCHTSPQQSCYQSGTSVVPPSYQPGTNHHLSKPNQKESNSSSTDETSTVPDTVAPVRATGFPLLTQLQQAWADWEMPQPLFPTTYSIPGETCREAESALLALANATGSPENAFAALERKIGPPGTTITNTRRKLDGFIAARGQWHVRAVAYLAALARGLVEDGIAPPPAAVTPKPRVPLPNEGHVEHLRELRRRKPEVTSAPN